MENPNERPPTLWQVIHSVLAAFFGVQSEANRRRDFTRGKPSQYIIVGLIATALFVLIMIGIVKLVLHLAGA
ncbi:MAG TPA: DUF2970 domain-containing protein [Nevskiales bacterium]|nr:DUF2970 domain-containing protein [Nevskiales bacterium]